MKISKRLKLIASMIDNENIVDVGCDHALLDIYLTMHGKNCIASDISDKVLENARNNIIKYNLEKKIKLIKSNGTQNIIIPTSSSIIIAGMGTHTIIDIVKNTNKNNIDELIIQSNNNLELLRKKIVKMDFYIEKENSIFEHGKYYVIIKFKKGKKTYRKKDYILGFLDKEYYLYLFSKNEEILKKLGYKNFYKKTKLKKINKWINKKLRNLA